MLDVRSLMVTVSVCSTALLGALWFGTRRQRTDGMGSFLYGLLAIQLTSVLIALRERLPYGLGVAVPNALFISGGFWIARAYGEFAHRAHSNVVLVVAFCASVLGAFALRDDFPARLVVFNGCMAIVCGFGAWRSLDATRGHRMRLRALLFFGSGLMALMGLLRALSGFSASAATGGLFQGWMQATSVVGLLVGTQSAAIAFLLLQRDRAEQGLASLNRTLEERVDAQVREITARAKEMARLNLELRQRADELSEEISNTLATEGDASGPDLVEPLAVGSVVRQRFALESELGRGGMGVVFRARDALTGEHVALKAVLAENADQLAAMHRFLREAKASAEVVHPSVVYARHVDLTGSNLFLVFELIDGLTLDEVLRRGVALTPGMVARLGAEIADALGAAHAKGVLHRDLKPANVMLSTKSPAVRLLDFGIARLRGAVQGDSTHESVLVGTPAYMAPEQVLEEAVDERADVYALGVLLFELLAGRLPFRARDVRGQLFNRVTHDAPSLRSEAPTVPEGLARLVDACLQRAPTSRPTARELATALARIADEARGTEAQLLELASTRSQPVAAPVDAASLRDRERASSEPAALAATAR